MMVQSAPAVYLGQPPNFQSKQRREEVGKEIILARGCKKERKRRRGKEGKGIKRGRQVTRSGHFVCTRLEGLNIDRMRTRTAVRWAQRAKLKLHLMSLGKSALCRART